MFHIIYGSSSSLCDSILQVDSILLPLPLIFILSIWVLKKSCRCHVSSIMKSHMNRLVASRDSPGSHSLIPRPCNSFQIRPSSSQASEKRAWLSVSNRPPVLSLVVPRQRASETHTSVFSHCRQGTRLRPAYRLLHAMVLSTITNTKRDDNNRQGEDEETHPSTAL